MVTIDLSGKAILMTGALGAIAEHMVRRLSAAGATLALNVAAGSSLKVFEEDPSHREFVLRVFDGQKEQPGIHCCCVCFLVFGAGRGWLRQQSHARIGS